VDSSSTTLALGWTHPHHPRARHGHLEEAIAGLLANNPREKFYAAAPEEGGSGATIIEFRLDDRMESEYRQLSVHAPSWEQAKYEHALARVSSNSNQTAFCRPVLQ
jgi:hypothetical protein